MSDHTRKCYAWRPGDTDTICELTEGHAGDHHNGELTWPRLTPAAIQEVLDQINAIVTGSDGLNATMHEAGRLCRLDGRHVSSDAIHDAERQVWQGLRSMRSHLAWMRNDLTDFPGEGVR